MVRGVVIPYTPEPLVSLTHLEWSPEARCAAAAPSSRRGGEGRRGERSGYASGGVIARVQECTRMYKSGARVVQEWCKNVQEWCKSGARMYKSGARMYKSGARVVHHSCTTLVHSCTTLVHSCTTLAPLLYILAPLLHHSCTTLVHSCTLLDSCNHSSGCVTAALTPPPLPAAPRARRRRRAARLGRPLQVRKGY